MWKSKVLDASHRYYEQFDLHPSQYAALLKKDYKNVPESLAKLFQSGEVIRIVDQKSVDYGVGFDAVQIKIERSFPGKIPTKKLSIEKPIEEFTEQLKKIKRKSPSVVDVKETRIAEVKIDVLKTHETIFERSTPRIFYPGQVFGFQREYHEYLVDPNIYPDHVPLPQSLYDGLLNEMTASEKNQFEEYRFRLFRSRVLADADIFCSGLCVDQKKEVLFAEDFMQWLEFGEGRTIEEGQKLKAAYILNILSQSHLGSLGAAAKQQLKKYMTVLPALSRLTHRFQVAEKKFHDHKKEVRIKPITMVATTAALEENMLKILSAISKAKQEKFHLAIFPELITSSYQLESVIASPHFMERHDQELFEINRYIRFLFAKEAYQFLNNELSALSVSKEQKALFLKDFFKKLYLYDLEFTYIEHLPKKNNGYLNWLSELGAVPTRQEMKEYCQKKHGKDHYEENINYYHGDNQPLEIDKQADVQLILKQTLESHFKEPGLTQNLMNVFFAHYEDFGIATHFGAIVRSNYDRPYNGSYFYKNDGTVVIELKKYLATETDNYFDEDKNYIKGNIHRKDVVLFRGRLYILNTCEMMFREERTRAIGMGLFPVIPVAAAAYIQDPQLRKKYLSGEILNIGGELVINISASPERHPSERAYPLHKVDWKNLPSGFSIHEGLGIQFENDRNETRKQIIRAITEYYGVDMVYLNTVGGYDIIAMGGGRILVDAKGQVIASHLNFQQGSTGFYLDGLSKIKLIHDHESGEHSLPPLEEIRAGIIQTTLHFLAKNQKVYAAMHHAGDETSSLMVKYLEEVQETNHLIQEKRVRDYFETMYGQDVQEYVKQEVNSRMRRAVYQSRLAFQNSEKIIHSEVKRTVRRLGIRNYVYGMPTLNPLKFVPKMAHFIGDKLRYRFEMQFTFIYFPEIFIPAAAMMVSVNKEFLEMLTGTPLSGNYALPFWHSALVSFPFYSVGLSFLVRIILADFLFYPLFNAVGKILGFTKKQGYVPSKKTTHKPAMGENVRHPIDQSYVPGLRHYLKDIGTVPQDPTYYQKLEKWSDLFNGYIGDLASEVRGALLERVLKIKKKLGKEGVAMGHISQKEVFLGQFPAGGVESKGWNMFLTINPNLKQALTLLEFKKDLAEKRNVIWRTYRSWRFKSYLKKIASYHSNKSGLTNFMRRYLSSWSINRAARLYYLRHQWNEIAAMATTPQRNAQLQKTIDQLSKKIAQLENSAVTPQVVRQATPPLRLPLNSQFRMRSTRGNKTVANQFMFGVLSQHLSYKDLKKMAVLKHTADPYDHLKDTDYAESVVYMISRMQASRYKTQSLQGPAFNISAPTSYKEPISQKPINKLRTRTVLLHHIKEFQRILIADTEELYKVIFGEGNKAIQFDFSRNHYVERSSEKIFIEEKILQLKNECTGLSKPVLVIKHLNSETDQYAFEMARKHGLEVVVLTSRSKLSSLKIPSQINGIRKLGRLRLFDIEEELQKINLTLPVKKFKYDL